MKRRDVFKLFGGMAVGVLPGFRASQRRERIGIVGGGILGSSIAYHLARRGAEVTLFERTGPAAGATQNSFAWINATFSKRPHHYHLLNRLGGLGYRHLEKELGGKLEVQWGGSLEWYGEPKRARWLREQVTHHQGWGYPVSLIDTEAFAALEPGVEAGEVLAASHSEQEGSIDPVATTRALLEAAEANGVRVESPCEVESLDLSWGRLRGLATTRGKFELDVLVVAAGTDTPRLAAMAGVEVPLIESPGVLAHTKPAPRAIGRVVLSPGAHLKQKLDGRLVAGMGFGSAPVTEASNEEGEKILASARPYLPAIEQMELERVTLGYRPLPRDGYPVVGFATGSPDVYLAVMHSGVTLAALMGRLVTMEVLDNVEVDLLGHYRQARFEKKRSS